MFLVESIFGHKLYIHISVCIVQKISPIFSSKVNRLRIAQLPYTSHCTKSFLCLVSLFKTCLYHFFLSCQTCTLFYSATLYSYVSHNRTTSKPLRSTQALIFFLKRTLRLTSPCLDLSMVVATHILRIPIPTRHRRFYHLKHHFH